MKDRSLMKLLSMLRIAPQRDARAAAAGKQRYMAQVDGYLAKGKLPAPATNRRAFLGQKNFAMAFLSALLVVVFLVTSGVGVAAAAQGSLPGGALYSVKTLSEDLRLAVTLDSSSKFDLLVNYVILRINEIDTLYEIGSTIPESASVRMGKQLDEMLLLAISMDDASMTESMVRIQKMLMAAYMIFGVNGDHDRIQDQRPDVPPTKDDARMIAIQKQNRDYLEITIVALTDPTGFRNLLAGGTGGSATSTGPLIDGGEATGPANLESGNADAIGPGPGEAAANNFGPGYIITTTISGTQIITTTLPGMWGPGVPGEGLLITDTDLITGKFGPGPGEPLFYSWGADLFGDWNDAAKQLKNHDN